MSEHATIAPPRPKHLPAKLAVLISGRGRTLDNLLRSIAAGQLQAEVAVVIASDAAAAGIEYATAAGIPSRVVDRRDFGNTVEFSRATFDACRTASADYVVMAGYIKYVRMPDDFALRVLNIHPALIPAFCGKGFYGHRVHQAVLDHGDKLTGCTVHFVDNQYDHGPIILQRTVEVRDGDTADTLAARVFEAECEAYPEALRLLLADRLRVIDRRVIVR